MTRTASVQREIPDPAPPTRIDGDFEVLAPNIDVVATEYCRLKINATAIESQMTPLKTLLHGDLAQREADENGHTRLELPIQMGPYVAIQRQRRVTTTVDEDRAREILTSKGIVDDCFVMVPVLSEDAVFAALRRGDLTDADIEEIFPNKESFAIVPVKK